MKNHSEFPKVMTMRQLSKAMVLHYDTIRHMHIKGRIPGARKVLGRVRILQDEFLLATGLKKFPAESSEEADVS